MFSRDDYMRSRGLIILGAFIPGLCWLGVLTNKSSATVWYTNLGIQVLILNAICIILMNIPIIGFILSGVLGLYSFIVYIINIIGAFTGEPKKLPIPVIGDLMIIN